MGFFLSISSTVTDGPHNTFGALPPATPDLSRSNSCRQKRTPQAFLYGEASKPIVSN